MDIVVIEEKITKFFWLFVVFCALCAGAWHGLCALVGRELIVESARSVATVGVYTVRYTCVIGIPTVGCILILSLFGGPMAVIARFRSFSREKFAKQRINEARAVAIAMDAKGKYRQSQYITVAGKSVLAIDTETGKQQYYIAPTRAELLAQENAQEDDNPFSNMDATQIFEHTFRKTVGKQNCPSLIIAGIKRSGKSTLMEYLSERYANEIDCTIFDPKQKDPLINWGPTTRVVGQNADYGAMLVEIERAEREVEAMEPDPNRKKRFYVFDEWTNLMPAEYDGADIGLKLKRGEFGRRIFNFMLRVLTEWAYLGIGVIIMPHALEKTAMGFPPGFGGLSRNFNGAIWFDYDEFADIRHCHFEFKGQRYEIPLWNPNTAPRHSHSVTPENSPFSAQNGPCDTRDERDGVTFAGHIAYQPVAAFPPPKVYPKRIYESKEEKRICQAHDDGLSLRSICDLIGLAVNGRNTTKIKSILSKYKIGN
jgi:hypothetical protein